jgi:hypothetical protein
VLDAFVRAKLYERSACVELGTCSRRLFVQWYEEEKKELGFEVSP